MENGTTGVAPLAGLWHHRFRYPNLQDRRDAKASTQPCVIQVMSNFSSDRGREPEQIEQTRVPALSEKTTTDKPLSLDVIA